MNEKWNILLYTSPGGDTPVKAFIDSLEVRAQAKVYYTMSLLEEFGTQLSSPHSKKLTGTDIWELRILGTDSIRIFYVATPGKTFLLLHGFKKKLQKTPQREIKTALTRWHEHQTRS